jgi:hypothetical protein
MAKKKNVVINGITINTKHELDLELIAQDGGIPQKRDLAAEAFENGEFSFTDEGIEICNRIVNNLFDRMDPNWRLEVKQPKI